jgi:hypothetical protein
VTCNVKELSNTIKIWLDYTVIDEEGVYYHCITVECSQDLKFAASVRFVLQQSACNGQNMHIVVCCSMSYMSYIFMDMSYIFEGAVLYNCETPLGGLIMQSHCKKASVMTDPYIGGTRNKSDMF